MATILVSATSLATTDTARTALASAPGMPIKWFRRLPRLARMDALSRAREMDTWGFVAIAVTTDTVPILLAVGAKWFLTLRVYELFRLFI